MTLETRLQLDNKKDLEFVFEGIVKEAEQLCCSPKVLEIVQNKLLKQVMSLTSESCLINGKPWNEIDESAGGNRIEEFEPVDSTLQEELAHLQMELDQLILETAELKSKIPKAHQTHFDKQCQDFISHLEQFPVDVKRGDAVEMPMGIDIVDEQPFIDLIGLLSELSHSLPPLVAKTDRYLDFGSEELAGEKFSQHLARLSTRCDNGTDFNQKTSVYDFRQMVKAKIEKSYSRAIQTRPLDL